MSNDVRQRLNALDALPPGMLLIHETFRSIQGESTYAGRPCAFVRMTGCNLRCRYCDTTHAFVDGEPMTIDLIMSRVGELGLPLVEVTGGEPMVQAGTPALLRRLCDAGHTVLLETNGSIDLSPVDPRVVKIMDLKTPSSGEVSANRAENLALLTSKDEIKIVLGDQGDYAWARAQVLDRRLHERCTVLLSTAFGVLEPAAVASWILADRLPVRLQVQLHKVLWPKDARGV